MKIELVLFDLDGTIVDSEPLAVEAIQDILSELGIDASPEDAELVTGRKWEAAAEDLFKKYVFPLEKEEFRQKVMKRYRELGESRGVSLIEGSIEAVKELGRELPIGLVSGSQKEEILWALERIGLGEEFDLVLGAEDYSLSKPAPDGYLKALKHFGCGGKHTLIFEDSSAGIASARAVGAWVAAIEVANHFGQDQSGANWRLKDFSGVDLEWVRNLKLS